AGFFHALANQEPFNDETVSSGIRALNGRPMGHLLQQFLPFGRIIDLGEFLRQIQSIPADDAILDEPFAGFGHLLVFLLSLQEFAWIADRDRARVETWFASGSRSDQSPPGSQRSDRRRT